uniref:ATP synthase mitochondrial F1 complex assembly factor 2 n=1 Tax=Chloropicon roscoffensis TaxID=1461544 RepID=A0A7S3C9U7_9CHLO
MAITMTRLARGGWVQLARGLECLRALPALSDASILAPRPPTCHGCVSGPQGRRGLSTGEKDGTISSLATSSVGRSDQGSTSPRFYKRATAARDEENEGLWCVKLDGRKLRTPSLKVLHLPNAALAHAIAVEWEYQSTSSIRAFTMPLMQLATTATDRAPKDRNENGKDRDHPAVSFNTAATIPSLSAADALVAPSFPLHRVQSCHSAEVHSL